MVYIEKEVAQEESFLEEWTPILVMGMVIVILILGCIYCLVFNRPKPQPQDIHKPEQVAQESSHSI